MCMCDVEKLQNKLMVLLQLMAIYHGHPPFMSIFDYYQFNCSNLDFEQKKSTCVIKFESIWIKNCMYDVGTLIIVTI